MGEQKTLYEVGTTELFFTKQETEIRKNSSLNIKLNSSFQFKAMSLPHGGALHAQTVLSVVSRRAGQIPQTVQLHDALLLVSLL